MKNLIILLILVCFFRNAKFEDPLASKDDIKRLENSIQMLTNKMASIDILDYAFKVSMLDASLKRLTSDVLELKQKASEPCNCARSGILRAPKTTKAPSGGFSDTKHLLQTILEKVDAYGHKLLPGHSSLLEKMTEVRNLVQNGFTKTLLSLSPIKNFKQDLDVAEASLGTRIDNKFAILQSDVRQTGHKLLPGHTSLLEKMTEVRNLVQNGFNKTLLSLSPIKNFKQDLDVAEASLGTRIDNKFAILQSDVRQTGKDVIESFANVSTSANLHNSTDESQHRRTIELAGKILNLQSDAQKTTKDLIKSLSNVPSCTDVRSTADKVRLQLTKAYNGTTGCLSGSIMELERRWLLVADSSDTDYIVLTRNMLSDRDIKDGVVVYCKSSAAKPHMIYVAFDHFKNVTQRLGFQTTVFFYHGLKDALAKNFDRWKNF